MTSVGCYLILKKKLWFWFFEKLMEKKKKNLKPLISSFWIFFLGIKKFWFQFSANFQNNKTFGFGFFLY